MRLTLITLAIVSATTACGTDTVSYPGELPAPPAGGGPAATIRPAPSSTSPAPAGSASAPPPPPSRSTETPPPSEPPPPTPATPTPAPTATTPKPAADPPLVPLFVGYHNATGDWIMSRVNGEGAPAYTYTGVQMKVFDAPPSSGTSAPLYRCVDKFGTHFQSNSSTCEGTGTREGLLGYVYSAPAGGAEKPIHRCIGSSGKPIVATLVLGDCTGTGLIFQGTIGYAFAP